MDKILNTPVDGKELTQKHKERLLATINTVKHGGYQHENQNKYSWIDGDALSFGSRHMTKLFRKKNDDGYYKKVLDTFFDCIDEACSYGKGKGQTKAYATKKWVLDDIYAYDINPEPVTLSKFNKRLDIHIPITSIPTKSVEDFDSLGNPKATNFNLPPMLTLNADALDNAINDFQSSAHYDETKRARYKNLNNMIDLRKSLNNTLCPNSIPVCYTESSSGRLSPSYGTSFPSVITMSKELKSLIFSGQGLVDVDISNAHLSIFNGLCKRYKIECPNIEYYLENKDELRRMWSEKFDVEVKLIKAYIISWLYGSTNYAIIRSDISDDLGLVALEAIQNDPVLLGIYDEIQRGRKVICDAHRNRNNLITNILGKEQPRKKRDRKNTLGSELAHIQFGMESKIMEIANSIIGDDFKLLIYDGYIGEMVDVSIIEEEVTKQLGFDIKFNVEEIQPPSLEDLMQFKKAKRNRWWKDKKKSA